MREIIVAREAILQDLRRRYEKGDLDVKSNKQWSTPYGEEDRSVNRISGAGRITPCPVCLTGKLGYSRSSYNGHVQAACSTPTCVRWME